MSNKIIVIVGPTASGKSELAVEIAKKFNGEVISADSRQVYKELNIGSNKITKKEMAGIRHHLINVASPKKTFTVLQYQKLAEKAMKDIWRRGKLPIFCGGTGFYIQAVVDGLAIPEVKPNPVLRRKLRKIETAELFKLLKKKDPLRAKTIDRYNRVRLIRALEIAETLGKVPKIKTEPLEAHILLLGVKVNKSELQKKIRQRILKWLRHGLVKEVWRLREQELCWRKIQSFGLVYKWAVKLAKKETIREDFIENLAKEIRNYAKRQMTWFKKDKRIHWLDSNEKAVKLVTAFLKNKNPESLPG